MRWLRRLFARQAGQGSTTALWIYVRCGRCGEAIRVRADRRYDLASEMIDPDEPGPAYAMHKDIVGDRCFQRIAVDLAFDQHQQVIGQQISGGAFLTEAEYLEAAVSRASSG
jgi:hypothetical protein